MKHHTFARRKLNLKWPALILTLLAAVVLFVGSMALPALSQEAPGTAVDSDFVVGLRMLHSNHFYAVAGLVAKQWDALVGAGFNNGFWVGAHALIAPLEEGGPVYGYGGFELTILPQDTYNDWKPSLALGLAYRQGRMGAALGASIYPGLRDVPVDVGFFVQFTYGILGL